MRKWQIAAITSSAALLILLLGLAFYIWGIKRKLEGRRLDSPAVITEIRRLNQLATVRYSIQRVVGIREPKVPVGEESILIMVQGEAVAGVDLTEFAKDDVMFSNAGEVVVSLPRAKLLSAYLNEDQTKIWDRSITWWTPWVPYNPELDRKARLQGLADVREAALKMGILEQAQRNAEVAVREVLSVFGIYPHFRPRSS